LQPAAVEAGAVEVEAAEAAEAGVAAQ